MPIRNYGLLRCKAIGSRREDATDTPHFQVHVIAGSTHFRLAVNVRSQSNPPDLLFLVDEDFRHPVTAELLNFRPRFNSLSSKPGGAALDFIRANLFDRRQMAALPDHDLSDRIEHFIDRAIQEPGAELFAFGQHWGPENKADQVFHFKPGNGVHDIHMNQGNDARFAGDDGVWQDGSLIVHYTEPKEQWVAFFMAFQSQAWHTDDKTGHALSQLLALGAAFAPSPQEPDFSVRIVAALVNPPAGGRARPSVTLLNASPEPVDLSGWKIADALMRTSPLRGSIAPGAGLEVHLSRGARLDRTGGLITLLDARGLKVDGVAYTGDQASRQGWTIVF
jgi:uncharacterized protein YukJ